MAGTLPGRAQAPAEVEPASLVEGAVGPRVEPLALAARVDLEPIRKRLDRLEPHRVAIDRQAELAEVGPDRIVLRAQPFGFLRTFGGGQR